MVLRQIQDGEYKVVAPQKFASDKLVTRAPEPGAQTVARPRGSGHRRRRRRPPDPRPRQSDAGPGWAPSAIRGIEGSARMWSNIQILVMAPQFAVGC